MDKKTLEALRKSIEKWEKIVAGKGEDQGSSNCALCQLFMERGCRGCPVFFETGITACYDTPYDDWINHQKDEHFYGSKIMGYIIKCPECKRLAQEELEFLKSLLPKKKENNQEG